MDETIRWFERRLESSPAHGLSSTRRPTSSSPSPGASNRRTRLRTSGSRCRSWFGQRAGRRSNLLIRWPGGHETAVEIKYPKARWSGVLNGEQFDLPDTAAHDLVRYDVVKDIARLERWTSAGRERDGFVLVVFERPGSLANACRSIPRPSTRRSASTTGRCCRVGDSGVSARLVAPP